MPPQTPLQSGPPLSDLPSATSMLESSAGGVLSLKKYRKHTEQLRSPPSVAHRHSPDPYFSETEVEGRKGRSNFALKAKRSGGATCHRRYSPLVGGIRRLEPGGAMTSRRVAPVGAQSGGNSAQLPFFGSILQMQLAKGLQTPYFEDGGNWADFAWEWRT